MTRMLVRIVDADEAVLAAKAGVDAIEVRVSNEIDLATARAARLAFAGLLRLRVDGLSVTPDLVARALSVRADEIALGNGRRPAVGGQRTGRTGRRTGVARVAVRPD